MRMADDPTTALVLSGGGAYAAYQVGVIRALARGRSPATGFRPLSAGILVGTSAGAVNAAVLASRPGVDPTADAAYLERVWLDGLAADPQLGRPGAVRIRGNPGGSVTALAGDGLTLAREFLARAPALLANGRPLPLRALELLDPSAVLDVTPFERVIREAIDLAAVRRSGRALRVLTTNWRTGELRAFRNTDMTDAAGHRAVRASAAFPGLKPIVIDGEPYVDGSYLMARPTYPAWEAGAHTMHLVYPDPDVAAVPLRRFDNVIDVLDKLFHITSATIFERDLSLVGDINNGLALLARDPAGMALPTPELRGILRLAGRLTQAPDGLPPFRPLTIHRYHPTDDLGGSLGVLNFDREHLAALIDRGYRDAAAHDCQRARCLLPPTGLPLPEERSP
jgi:NTE family protein